MRRCQLLRMKLSKQSIALLYLILCTTGQICGLSRNKRDTPVVYQLVISLHESLHYTTSRFLSVALGTNRIINNFSGMNLGSNFMKNIAAALAPCNIRIGGTRSHFMTFLVGDAPLEHPSIEKDTYFNLYSSQWLVLSDFIKSVGWETVFNFNLFQRQGGNWDPANAKLFLDFSVEHNISIEGFHIGNEVNAYFGNGYMEITPKTFVSDIKILKNVLSTYPKYKKSKVLGPEVTRFNKRSASEYLDSFLKEGGCDIVDEVTFHHYYVSGYTAKVEEFTNVTVLECLEETFQKGNKIMKDHNCLSPFRMTETSSVFGGGTEAMTDRYVAGFLWLDKLGQAALNGVTVVNRQTYYGGFYGLISFKNKLPTPDYFLSLLFKRLVEGPVFKVSSPTKMLRAYCQCARKETYKPGAIVVYYLNLAKEPSKIRLPQFVNHVKDVYSLTPEHGDLAARRVLLNGKRLVMSGDEVPKTPPKKVSGDVPVEGQTFGFLVVPDANQALCTKHYMMYSTSCCSRYYASSCLRIITVTIAFLVTVVKIQ